MVPASVAAALAASAETPAAVAALVAAVAASVAAWDAAEFALAVVNDTGVTVIVLLSAVAVILTVPSERGALNESV